MSKNTTNSEALEELKIAQDVITHQENFTFKIFGWAIGIVTALTLGLFHEKVNINGYAYIVTALITVLIFLSVAKKHWETFYKAIQRSEEIESELKTGTYTQFKLNETLSSGKKINLFQVPRLYLPYLALVVLVLISGTYKLLT